MVVRSQFEALIAGKINKNDEVIKILKDSKFGWRNVNFHDKKSESKSTTSETNSKQKDGSETENTGQKEIPIICVCVVRYP